MAGQNAQEKTEQPTPKRLRDAREKGQVARSRELTTMGVLLASAAGILFIGGNIITGLLNMMGGAFRLNRSDLMDIENVPRIFEQAMIDSIWMLLPFFTIVVAAALLSPMALSGWSFSMQAIAFKWEKLDPVKGMARIFSWRGLMELLKALAKFSVVLVVALILLWHNVDLFLILGTEDIANSLSNAGSLLGWSFLALSSAMILIAAFDVPFQLWDHNRQLKMTRQEVKDEYKETDGSPDLKRRIREVQMEMARRRMMQEVPKADVVITNPTHYAVALRYDQSRMSAPVVVAKGQDLIAQQIRNIAMSHDVPIMTAPPLARALYFSTELQQEIPSGLYMAVAQVLAYIFQLRKNPRKKAEDTLSLADLPIPEEFRRD